MINSEITSALSGQFRVVLVSGAAGLGKTRLVKEVLDTHAAEAICVSARSYRWGATASFGAWVEALDPYLRSFSEEDLRLLCGPSIADLSAIFRSVRDVTGEPAGEPPRSRLLEGLVDLCLRLSERRPLVVLLDDVHLADTSSWEALRYLGRWLPASPIGVMMTARPVELAERPDAREVLLGLEEDDRLHRVRLKPLARHEIAELAHEVLRADGRPRSSFVPERLITWLAERTLGHPLFIIGLLRALIEEGADFHDPRLDRLPETLRDRVALDLAALDSGDRETLELLAVLDHRIALSDLASLSGRSEGDLHRTLEVLSASQLVTEDTSAADLAYEVAHPIVQDVIYEGIGGARRRSIHRAVARMRLGTGELGLAAAHFARGAHAGEDEAVEALFQAIGQAEARGLYREALVVLDALVDLLPRGDERWLRVLDVLSWRSDWVLSHLAERDAGTAVSAMERVGEVVDQSGDARQTAIVCFHLASLLSFGMGLSDEAESLCQRAADLFASVGEEDGFLIARNELAWIRGTAGDLVGQVELASEVLESAQRQGRSQPAIQAAGTAGFGLGLLGRLGEAESMLESAIRLAESAENSYRVVWGRAQRSSLLALAGRLDEAIASVERALEEDAGAPDAIALEVLAFGRWLGGRMHEGVAAVERSAVRRPMHGSRRRAWASAMAARMYAEMGHLGRAEANLDLATSTYGGQPMLQWSSWCDWTRGFLAWQAGDHDAAIAALGRAAGWLESIGAVAYESLVLVDLVEVAADSDDTAVREHAVARLGEIDPTVGSPLHSALAVFGRAHGALAEGSFLSAAESAGHAAEELDGRGYRLFAGRARHLQGRASEHNDRSAAVDALEEAARIFDECGATWRRDHTLAALTRLGSRGRRAAAGVQGPGSLTAREREIAELAANGYTAREIGERLFISDRTVESHLANAYAKLGVGTKRELIQRATALGLRTTSSP